MPQRNVDSSEKIITDGINVGCKSKSTRKIEHESIYSESKQYWKNVFDEIDKQQKIPNHFRRSVLQRTLAPQIYAKVTQIINPKEETQFLFDAETSALIGFNGEIGEKREHLKKEEMVLPVVEVQAKSPFKKKTDFAKKLLRPPEEIELNMYGKFWSKDVEQAARWKTKYRVPKFSLNRKCTEKTRAIAAEFVNWMNDLGGKATTGLGVEEIVDLFEFGVHASAAETVRVKIRELNALPDNVALIKKMPHSSYSTKLYEQIFRDVTSLKRREELFAFGTMLPPELRTGTLDTSTAYRWIENARVPEKIASMAVVWEGIENLSSTTKYCEWLMDHPYISLPGYLVKKGILGKQETLDSPKQHRRSTISLSKKTKSDSIM